MTDRAQKVYRWALGGLALLALAVGQTGVRQSFELQPSTFQPVKDLAFSAPLSRPAVSAASDSNDDPQRSSLILFEDGRPLGPAHSLHESIWTKGGGAYSHWGDSVIFSTSDNSDPRTNGRRYEISARVPRSALFRGLAVAAASAALLALLWPMRVRVRAALRAGLEPAGWLRRAGRLALVAVALALAPDISTSPVAGLTAVAAIAGLAAYAVRGAWRSEAAQPLPGAWPWVCAGLSFIAPAYLLQYLSTPVAPDSFSYWMPWDLLGVRLMTTPPMRPPLLPVIHALLDGIGAEGGVLIAGQVILRAVGVLLVTRALARLDAWVGLVGGLLLALDPVSAGQSLQYLSESVHASLWLVVLSLLLEIRGPARPLPLLFGVVLGIAGMVRTIGAPIAAASLAAASVLARSRTWVARTALGVLLVVAPAAGLNWLQTSHAWGSQGLYLAFPLFIQKQFLASNGPASQRIHLDLARCGLEGLEQQVVLNNSNENILTRFNPCLVRAAGGDLGRLDRDYSRAYREAWLARPFSFAWATVKESLLFFAEPLSAALWADQSFATLTDVDEFCQPRANEATRGFRAFVCPLPFPAPDPDLWIFRISRLTRHVYQPYLHFTEAPWSAMPAQAEAVGLAALAWMAWLAFVARPSLRPAVLLTSLLLVLHAVGTALGQASMLRYTAPMAPLFLILTAVSVATVLGSLGCRVPAALTPAAGAPRDRGRRVVAILGPALLAAMATVVSVVTIEVGLRLVERMGTAPPPPPTLRRDPRLGWNSIPSATPLGEGPDQILFVGDSFTQSSSWPRQALDRVRAAGRPTFGGWNLGVAGYGTTQEWLKTRDWISQSAVRPRALVLLVYPWNDLRDNLATPSIYYNHQTRQRPYWVRNGGDWTLSTPFFWPDFLYNAKLTERLVRLYDARDARRHQARRVDGAALSGGDLRLGYADPRSWDPLYRTQAQDLPYVSEAWLSTERTLVELRDLARAAGAPLVVLALDNAFTVDQDVLDQWVPQREGFDPLLPLARMDALTRKLGIDFTDLQPRLLARARAVGGKIYNGPPGNLSGHLEPHGDEEVARAAAEAVLRALSRPGGA